ncbi:PepSY-associated TM helix domain-containing protein [Rathayibacter toxicus]|uniref:PepSY domain-containing protein n=2 Tax=Rathayibacter toxicus TaxID=145458 RepID=A0A2S5Y9X9_9MICO|nr:PepSY domain-containing protein [Rathayibacter toxicus]PPG24791.1 PepSY domain-containing protein [Rathayibacter toxicus]PPG48246.1 PepSY domain-containing protein [Rathayibacter toxicus]PPH25542.1 PepSY domain-containing protein [Rathayibacter toxicus]PPH59241.1 PepSY domain-containing protein [Rathayibacter toxicus]PPH61354.1 PepSY domain-containing protein [Rathayibacter toxicus]
MIVADDHSMTPQPASHAPAAAPSTMKPTPNKRRGWFMQFLLRLHFYAGLFVGPFLLVAALSGAVYALGPTIEQSLYRQELTAPSTAAARPLAEQIDAAQAYVAQHHPEDTLAMVRPASEQGDTTRVMYSEADLPNSQRRAIFIDPGSTEVRGDQLVSGIAGALPFRTWVKTFHRSLFLGDIGRLYSETAASWLGVVALAGLGLWVIKMRKSRAKRDLIRPARGVRGYRRVFSWHASTGIWLLLGALFLSATGITLSHYAGGNIDQLRSALDWEAPTLSTALATSRAASTAGESADPHGGSAASKEKKPATVTPALFDEVLAAAKNANIHSSELQITPPKNADQAWTVAEIKRSFPTAMNSVAINPKDMSVVSETNFDTFSLPAKLIRWGIDTHTGMMWGLPNQIVLFVTALGIVAMVAFGYIMWWQRRPTGKRVGKAPSAGALLAAPWWGSGLIVVGAIIIGAFLPALGVTLVAFVVIDVLVTRLSIRSRSRSTE